MFLNFFQIHWAESTQGACVHCDVFISHANVGWVSVYAVLFTGLCSLSRYDIKIKILIFLSLQMLNSICVKIHLLFMIFFFSAFFKGFTKKEAGLLVAVSAALDLVGRLGFGYLCDLQIFDRKKAFVVWYVEQWTFSTTKEVSNFEHFFANFLSLDFQILLIAFWVLA